MRIINKIMSTVLILVLIIGMSACSSQTVDEQSTEEIDTSNTTVESYEEEAPDAEIKDIPASEEDFYGTWIAASEAAEYYYGNVSITVKENGKWDGVITGEKISGKWKKDENFLKLSSELFECTLLFTETGKLIMREFIGENPDNASNDDYINTVLSRK